MNSLGSSTRLSHKAKLLGSIASLCFLLEALFVFVLSHAFCVHTFVLASFVLTIAFALSTLLLFVVDVIICLSPLFFFSCSFRPTSLFPRHDHHQKVAARGYRPPHRPGARQRAEARVAEATALAAAQQAAAEAEAAALLEANAGWAVSVEMHGRRRVLL